MKNKTVLNKSALFIHVIFQKGAKLSEIGLAYLFIGPHTRLPLVFMEHNKISPLVAPHKHLLI